MADRHDDAEDEWFESILEKVKNMEDELNSTPESEWTPEMKENAAQLRKSHQDIDELDRKYDERLRAIREGAADNAIDESEEGWSQEDDEEEDFQLCLFFEDFLNSVVRLSSADARTKFLSIECVEDYVEFAEMYPECVDESKLPHKGFLTIANANECADRYGVIRMKRMPGGTWRDDHPLCKNEEQVAAGEHGSFSLVNDAENQPSGSIANSANLYDVASSMKKAKAPFIDKGDQVSFDLLLARKKQEPVPYGLVRIEGIPNDMFLSMEPDEIAALIGQCVGEAFGTVLFVSLLQDSDALFKGKAKLAFAKKESVALALQAKKLPLTNGVVLGIAEWNGY